jgi:hypothetical protein
MSPRPIPLGNGLFVRCGLKFRPDTRIASHRCEGAENRSKVERGAAASLSALGQPERRRWAGVCLVREAPGHHAAPVFNHRVQKRRGFACLTLLGTTCSGWRCIRALGSVGTRPTMRSRLLFLRSSGTGPALCQPN